MSESMRERVAKALSYTSLALHPNPGPQRDAMVREATDAVLAAVADALDERCGCIGGEPGTCGACEFVAYLTEPRP